MIGKVDNNLEELTETVNRSCKIDFYDRSSGVGNGIYGRTAQFMLIVAVKKLFGEDTETIVHYTEISDKELRMFIAY